MTRVAEPLMAPSVVTVEINSRIGAIRYQGDE
jgi:hypothetical protein